MQKHVIKHFFKKIFSSSLRDTVIIAISGISIKRRYFELSNPHFDPFDSRSCESRTRSPNDPFQSDRSGFVLATNHDKGE